MQLHDSPLRKRAARALDGLMIMLAVLLIVQIWLLMASVESWLAGHRGVALPAAVLSGCLFMASLALMALGRRVGRQKRDSSGS